MKNAELPHNGPTMSALCRTVKKDGWDLDIVIYADGEGQWSLEIHVDETTATHWLELFDTEQQALDAALRAIETEDIAEWHMPQPWRAN